MPGSKNAKFYKGMLVSESPETKYIFLKIFEYKNWKLYKNVLSKILTILCRTGKFCVLYTH
jgi:hypothetical protein